MSRAITNKLNWNWRDWLSALGFILGTVLFIGPTVMVLWSVFGTEGTASHQFAASVADTWSHPSFRLVSGGVALLLMISWLMNGLIGGWRILQHRLAGVQPVWFLVMFFAVLPVVALIIFLASAALLGNVTHALSRQSIPVQARCPYCQSWIPRDAVVCRHCGRDVPT